MKVAEHLRPVDLARAVGLSTQMIRRYERWGFLPPSERGENRYRRYGPHHLDAIRTARVMIAGYGWAPALRILRLVHAGDPTAAYAKADERHAELHRERLALTATLGALQAVAGAADLPATSRRRLLLVGEAAAIAGVRLSALRFWEEQGLLEPYRDPQSGYRLFDEEQVRRLQVVVLLRRAGYDLPQIRPVLEELAAGRPERALAAAQRRMRDLAEASRRCAEATGALVSYLNEWEAHAD